MATISDGTKIIYIMTVLLDNAALEDEENHEIGRASCRERV